MTPFSSVMKHNNGEFSLIVSDFLGFATEDMYLPLHNKALKDFVLMIYLVFLCCWKFSRIKSLGRGFAYLLLNYFPKQIFHMTLTCFYTVFYIASS